MAARRDFPASDAKRIFKVLPVRRHLSDLFFQCLLGGRSFGDREFDRATVARCPKTAPSEGETLLAAQVKRWKNGKKVLVNQPQRQKTERGVLLENIVRVDDVLLDSGSDVTVVTRGVMDALDAAGVEVGIVSHSVPHFVYPYGSDAKQVVMTRSVKFNCVTLDTTCGPLVLRGLKAWVTTRQLQPNSS
ncbi:hypothetical protein DYB26_009526 [Aphanomyces astaci]|uniref:Peptidase A2 domain-containing protein n=1 Tax=Aphanomyces astaci TaxID=112090 RepID=A0A3R7BPQ5_APHAT|nr:hypothetical protein DYB26_009526 [Aphanomyces astaci]